MRRFLICGLALLAGACDSATHRFDIIHSEFRATSDTKRVVYSSDSPDFSVYLNAFIGNSSVIVLMVQFVNQSDESLKFPLSNFSAQRGGSTIDSIFVVTRHGNEMSDTLTVESRGKARFSYTFSLEAGVSLEEQHFIATFGSVEFSGGRRLKLPGPVEFTHLSNN